MKKNLYFYYGYPSTREEKARLIKEVGFDGVFLFADQYLEENAIIVRKNDLNIETVHLPFNKVCNSIWLEDEAGEDYTNDLINWVRRTRNIGCDKVIFHVAQSMTPPPTAEIGFNRLKRIIKVCEEEKVFLAIENLRATDYMDECLEKCPSPYVCCCFDCGHAHAFTHNIEIYDFEKYKGLIKCLHLHDNHGERDEHLPVFEGNIDFKKLMKDLRSIDYNGDLTLELLDKVEKIPEKEFLEKALESLEVLEDYFNK